jgi:drug/metabolite transporter (DMT)-like permease
MPSRIFAMSLPMVALVLSHVIWGGNFIVAKVTLQEFPVYTLAFLRFALASLLLAPFFLAETKKVKIEKSDLPKLSLVGILMITVNISFFFAGIKETSAISASALTLIIPLLSVLLGWWFLKEKVYIINLLGISLGLIGALIIIGLHQIAFGSFSSEDLVGNIFIVLASVSFVIGAMFSRDLLKKYPSMIVTAVAFLIGVVTFFPPAVQEYLSNPSWTSQVTALGLIGLLYMVLLSSISSYFLFEWGLAKTSLIRADLFQYIEPIVATILAVLILGERVPFSFVIGAVLIILGVYWGTLGKERHHHHKPHHKPHRV